MIQDIGFRILELPVGLVLTRYKTTGLLLVDAYPYPRILDPAVQVLTQMIAARA
jgi:hypothetical protein